LADGDATKDFLMHQYLDFFGIESIWVSVPETTTATVEFGQAYPNPFTDETNISFSLSEEMNISIDVYNMSGQKVTTLGNSNYTAGTHILKWNARADGASEGIYFFRMLTENEVITRKVILMH
jgi:hypothetical protein